MSKSGTVNIIVNGKPDKVSSGTTIADLLSKRRMRAELVTVEIDDTILQKLDYETTEIREGNKLEFIYYMGGGD